MPNMSHFQCCSLFSFSTDRGGSVLAKFHVLFSYRRFLPWRLLITVRRFSSQLCTWRRCLLTTHCSCCHICGGINSQFACDNSCCSCSLHRLLCLLGGSSGRLLLEQLF